MDSMASSSQVSVQAKHSTTLNASVANPGSEGASSGSNSELNTESVSQMMASLSLNPLAREFIPSNMRINPNQGLNHLAPPYPGMETQEYPHRSSSWRNDYNNDSEVRYRTRRTVFVSNIDNNVTEEQLAELFSNQGEVMDCRICGNPYSTTLRFAFIEFADPKSARAALNLSGVKLGSSEIRVMRSKTAILPVNPSYAAKSEGEMEKCARTVCCTNIDNQVSRAELKDFFETSCGEVSVMRHLRGGNHETSMAFIEFVTAESAIQALGCSGEVLGSYRIRVNPSKTPVRSRVRSSA